MWFRRTLALSLLLGVLAPAPALADGMVIPFIGVNFGGNSGRELSRAIDVERFDWGASFTFMGGGILGIEADIAHSPDFYGRTDVGGSSVLTATGNMLIGIPIGGQKGVGIRPYVLAGLGMIRSEIDTLGDALGVDHSDAAWSFGGGAMFFFGTNVGLRADLRYFQTFRALDLVDVIDGRGRLDFARASAGLILRF